ncbi:MAG: AI-2E family transporter [Planctomycetota bacterium]
MTTAVTPAAQVPLVASPAPARGALALLACLALLWTAYFAKPILAPIAIAVLLKFLLSPLMRGLKRRFGIPLGLSAALLVGGSVGGLAMLVVGLTPAALHWTDEMPERMQRLEGRLLAIAQPVAAINAATEEVAEKVEDLTAAAGDKKEAPPPVVRIESPSWAAVALGAAQRVAVEFFIILVMLYLLLLSDGLVLAKLENAGTPGARRMANALRAIEDRISVYVTSLLVVHGTLGVLVGLVAWLVGMPNPILWGLVAAVGNAVPFVGPVVVTSLLAIVSITTFDDLGPAMIAPSVYLLLHLLESNVVTPCLLGRWLSLSPVAIFVALLTMGFLWGIAGLLLSVPLLVVLKITSEHLPWLKPLQIALDGTRLTPRSVPDAHALAI